MNFTQCQCQLTLGLDYKLRLKQFYLCKLNHLKIESNSRHFLYQKMFTLNTKCGKNEKIKEGTAERVQRHREYKTVKVD